jgi:hypothetical protein
VVCRLLNEIKNDALGGVFYGVKKFIARVHRAK